MAVIIVFGIGYIGPSSHASSTPMPSMKNVSFEPAREIDLELGRKLGRSDLVHVPRQTNKFSKKQRIAITAPASAFPGFTLDKAAVQSDSDAVPVE